MPENVEIKAKVQNVHDLTNKAKKLSASEGRMNFKSATWHIRFNFFLKNVSFFHV